MNCHSLWKLINAVKFLQKQKTLLWSQTVQQTDLWFNSLQHIGRKKQLQESPDGQSESPALPGLSGNSGSGHILWTLAWWKAGCGRQSRNRKGSSQLHFLTPTSCSRAVPLIMWILSLVPEVYLWFKQREACPWHWGSDPGFWFCPSPALQLEPGRACGIPPLLPTPLCSPNPAPRQLCWTTLWEKFGEPALGAAEG